jgi:hypothetical protein
MSSAHPKLGEHRERSDLWKPTSKNRIRRLDYLTQGEDKNYKGRATHAHRSCYSHEYIGDGSRVLKNQEPKKPDYPF